MAYKRKTRDEYEIQSYYDGEWSCETTEDTLVEAKSQLRCYRDNMSVPLRIKKVRIPI